MLTKAPNFGIDDRFDTIYQFCEILNPIWLAPAGERWRLDLRNCTYLGPDAATLTYATFLLGAEKGQHPEVLLPDTPLALAAFCQFSGMKHYLAGGKYPTTDHPECETEPLRRFYQVVGNQSASVVELVRRHMEISDDNEVYLSAAFQEVVQNIEDHSASPIGGVTCARFFSSSGDIRVAVVDLGVGFPGSLRKILGEIPAVEALRRVLVDGVSGKSRDTNMGLGLSHLASFVRNLRGELIVLTHDAVARLDSGKQDFEFQRVGVFFPGTAIFFRLNIKTRVG